MTDDQKQELYTDIYELLDIFNEFSPIKDDGSFILEAIKPTVHSTGFHKVPRKLQGRFKPSYT